MADVARLAQRQKHLSGTLSVLSHVEFRGNETISESDRPRMPPKESSISSSGNDEEKSFTNSDSIKITFFPRSSRVISQD